MNIIIFSFEVNYTELDGFCGVEGKSTGIYYEFCTSQVQTMLSECQYYCSSDNLCRGYGTRTQSTSTQCIVYTTWRCPSGFTKSNAGQSGNLVNRPQNKDRYPTQKCFKKVVGNVLTYPLNA